MTSIGVRRQYHRKCPARVRERVWKEQDERKAMTIDFVAIASGDRFTHNLHCKQLRSPSYFVTRAREPVYM